MKNLATSANCNRKRSRGKKFYGLNFKKSAATLKETDDNRLYKAVKWSRDRRREFGSRGYCYICGGNCGFYMGGKQKRGGGQKPRNKNKPWRKRGSKEV